MSDDPISALVSELLAEADHLAFDGKIRLPLDAGFSLVHNPSAWVVTDAAQRSILFWDALREGESSSNAGGLIVWPIKFFILAGFALLLAQCFSEIIKRWAVIRGLRHD